MASKSKPLPIQRLRRKVDEALDLMLPVQRATALRGGHGINGISGKINKTLHKLAGLCGEYESRMKHSKPAKVKDEYGVTWGPGPFGPVKIPESKK
jgi:hypothetical protein